MAEIYIDPEKIKKYAKFIKNLSFRLSQNISEIEIEFSNLSLLWRDKEFNSFAFQYIKSLKYVKQFIEFLDQHYNKLMKKHNTLIKMQSMEIENSLSKLSDKIQKTHDNEFQKIMNISVIANYINKLDSIENIEQNLIGEEKLKDRLNNELREIGYTLVSKDDNSIFASKKDCYIRRHSIKDNSGIEKVRLTIGKKPDGKHYFKIAGKNNQLFYTKSCIRISVPGKLNSNLENELQRQRPENHEAHHLIPDTVAQNDPFIKVLISKGLFDIDHAFNGIWLPRDLKAKMSCQESYHLPIHKGNHPKWNVFVMTLLNSQKNLLELKYNKKISMIDSNILSKALEHVENTLKNKIENNEWEAYWK